jgi:hypothetical protein
MFCIAEKRYDYTFIWRRKFSRLPIMKGFDFLD